MTDEPRPIRPLPEPEQLERPQAVRFTGTDEVDVLQAVTQWCLQHRGHLTILAMNWSYATPHHAPGTGHGHITVHVLYELPEEAQMEGLLRAVELAGSTDETS